MWHLLKDLIYEFFLSIKELWKELAFIICILFGMFMSKYLNTHTGKLYFMYYTVFFCYSLIYGQNYHNAIQPELYGHDNIWNRFQIYEIEVNGQFDQIIGNRHNNMLRMLELFLQRQQNAQLINNNRPINDTQNVHDPTVLNYIVNAVDKLKKKQQLVVNNDDNYIINVRRYITSFKSNNTIENETYWQDRKYKALKALNYIITNNGFITKLNMYELDVLKLVWNRINDPINHNKIHLLKEHLLQQLADCELHNNSFFCIQGRVLRILQSLQVNDQEKIMDMKPLWAVKEEIAGLFGKYRNKLISSLPVHIQEVYNNNTELPNHLKAMNKLKEIMSNKIHQNLRHKYIETKILTEQQYQDITQPYFNEL